MVSHFSQFIAKQLKPQRAAVALIVILLIADSAVALVSQDTALSFGTIFENIAYGMPNADYTLIQVAAKKAGAHQFITALADGYNTVIGENGVLLSGGQRQRLSLARALLMNAEIALLEVHEEA